MATITDIEYQIKILTELYDEYIAYNDSLDITDENEKVYVVSDTLLANVQKSSDTAIQELHQQKANSLKEYTTTTTEDTTLYNLCFDIYKTVDDDKFDGLYELNDLMAKNRTDIDPLNPIIPKGTLIKYNK